MKRYGQRCPAAIALDVVGERWTPLIVRELMLGPKRFTDLADGLPGIGTNVLTTRLAGLQEHGVVEKRTLPRPTPVAVYELTEPGRALAPVLRELRAWGARYGPAPQPGDAVQPAWIIQSAAGRNPRLAPGRTCELRVGDDVVRPHRHRSRLDVMAGTVPSPEAVVTLEPRLFLRLASGRIDPRTPRADRGRGRPASGRRRRDDARGIGRLAGPHDDRRREHEQRRGDQRHDRVARAGGSRRTPGDTRDRSAAALRPRRRTGCRQPRPLTAPRRRRSRASGTSGPCR